MRRLQQVLPLLLMLLKAAQDAAALIAQGAGNALYAKTEANKALINQFLIEF